MDRLIDFLEEKMETMGECAPIVALALLAAGVCVLGIEKCSEIINNK